MDFGLTEEQRVLKSSVYNVMRKECPKEYIEACEQEERFPKELFSKIAKLGWTTFLYPETYGGQSGDYVSCGVIIEEIAYRYFSAGSIYQRTSVILGMAILEHGTEEQKSYLLKEIGKGKFLAFGLTEPEAGSDAAAVKTRAKRNGSIFKIQGSKMFCTGAKEAERILLVARTKDTPKKQDGLTIFLLDPKREGVTFSKVKKLGIKSQPTYEISLSDVEVFEDEILGGSSGFCKGWSQVLSCLDRERYGCALICTGGAQSALDEAVTYAKERVQFGRPISKFQVIRHRIADLQTSIDASRLLSYKVGWMLDKGMKCRREASSAKLFASETYMKVAHDALQIMGGYGYTKEFSIERHFRDAKLYEIGGGTSEIQRAVISHEMEL